METLFHVADSFAATAVSALLSSIWEGLILSACVGICLRLLPRLSASARSIVWLNVFVLVALLHLIPSLAFFARTETSALTGSPAHAPIELDLRWSLAVALAWGLLSLGKAVQLALSAVKLRGLVRRATPIETDRALRQLLKTSDGFSGRSAELCVSEEVERPSVFGFFKPRILLPPELLAELSEAELRQVVIHEMEHLRRGDDWTNLLQKICLVVFPVNPVLLWVERRLCAERELACDDSVLRSSCGRKAYALCLTHLAEHSMLRRGYALVLGAWERQSELVRRVHRILRRPADAMNVRQAKMVTAGIMIAVLGGWAALARSPQLVGFVASAQPALDANSTEPSIRDERLLRPADFETGALKAQMVKAVVADHAATAVSPNRQPRAGQGRTSGLRPNQASTSMARQIARPQFVESQQAFVVLTEWSETEVQPHVVFAVDRNNRVAYAAVATANGWLILQI